jgi:ABC-type antimicrobial peptide transport system permease subunit
MKPPSLQPPAWILRFLAFICPDHLYEEIEGDLIQRFNRDLGKFPAGKSRRRFIWNTVRFFRPGILLRNKIRVPLIPLYMIANYFKVATRVMLRNKAFSFINVSGLALGITSAILLFLWIEKEFSYDQFHADKERIYKAFNRTVIDGQLQCWDRTPRILGPTLAADYSAIESAVTYRDQDAVYLFTVGDTKIMMNGGVYADNEFLSMFSFPLIKGNPATALSTPNSIVLTEQFAADLFGDKDPFGETVTIWEASESYPLVVSGILKELPSNTDFHIQYIIPFHVLESIEGKTIDWNNNSVNTFVKLKPGADPAALNNQIRDITKQHASAGNTTEVFLYPFEKVHLYSRFENGVPAGGRIEIMRMLGILGLSLLFIACINFINLSTARAQKRAKEIGIRKVTGANRIALVFQFLCESILLAAAAGMIALGIVYLLLPAFSTLIQQPITLNIGNAAFWLVVVGGIVLVGMLAGFYPALYLSSFQPVRVLKGSSISSSDGSLLRRVLVVVQFGFVITMIVSSVVVRKQILYVQNREAGYNRDNMVYHFITGDIDKNYRAYKHELLQQGLVESMSKTRSPITEPWSNTWAMEWDGKDPQSKVSITRFGADENFTKTAGLTLVAGRDLDLDLYPTDSTAMLLNEAAVKLMGFKNPIGETVKDGHIKWHVVGVVKNFIMASPFHRIEPMVIQGSKSWMGVIHMRLNPNKPVPEVMAGIGKLFTKYNSAYPFDYYFVDASYARKFSNVEGTLMITTIASAVVIFIACLGLLGLSTYMIEARVKEIGIRKVLGGSVLNITRLLCTSSLKPIVAGIVLFTPGAWFGMNWWLQSFDYRIDVNISLLLLAAGSTLAIALLTIGTQTFRAAKANPVDSLRSE